MTTKHHDLSWLNHLNVHTRRNWRRTPNTTVPPPCSPPPGYSAVDPGDRLTVQHPSPASIRSQPPRRSSAPSPVSHAPSAVSPTQKQKDSEIRSVNTSQLQLPTPPSSPPLARKCTQCKKHLEIFEFPTSTPTSQCQHPNTTCSYCLHNMIMQAINTSGWDNVPCPQCSMRLSRSEIERGVLLWIEKGDMAAYCGEV